LTVCLMLFFERVDEVPSPVGASEEIEALDSV
jgi:hypothetical protein